MAWVKSNPHLVTLLIAALGLFAASALFMQSARGFNERFESVQQPPPSGKPVAPLDLSALETSQKAVSAPAHWQPSPELHLFVPNRYSVSGDKLVPEKEGEHNIDPFSKKPIPDSWFTQNHLQATDPTIALQDADKDGFTNADEWRDKTDPNDPKSHPPYYTKLFLKQFIRVPFRLKFQAYDGEPKKPEEMQFQINTLDLRQPSQFLKIGDMVPKTKFKIEKFEFKEAENKFGGKDDVSELTISDTETANKVVLIMNKITDSPDSFALFQYLWPKPPFDIRVKKLQEFVLKPDVTQKYKLIDISESQAVVQIPSGETVTIIAAPAGFP